LHLFTLYSPASIARPAIEKGWVELGEVSIKLGQQRFRIALARYAKNHRLPINGDGLVRVQGQAPTPGWFGWRWQRDLPEDNQIIIV
jgi:hypothetical protein